MLNNAVTGDFKSVIKALLPFCLITQSVRFTSMHVWGDMRGRPVTKLSALLLVDLGI